MSQSSPSHLAHSHPHIITYLTLFDPFTSPNVELGCNPGLPQNVPRYRTTSQQTAPASMLELRAPARWARALRFSGTEQMERGIFCRAQGSQARNSSLSQSYHILPDIQQQIMTLNGFSNAADFVASASRDVQALAYTGVQQDPRSACISSGKQYDATERNGWAVQHI